LLPSSFIRRTSRIPRQVGHGLGGSCLRRCGGQRRARLAPPLYRYADRPNLVREPIA